RATHSGENSASGQNAERPGSSTAWASSATGGRMSGSAASGTSGSASGGPSISTTAGRAASRAARTARADPGPWCRTPSSSGPTAGHPGPGTSSSVTSTVTPAFPLDVPLDVMPSAMPSPSCPVPAGRADAPARANPACAPDGAAASEACRSRAGLPAGAVEVLPAVALADHGLEIFLPDDPVGRGIAHDRAEQARRHVPGPQHPVAEVGCQGQPAGDDGDGLRRRQRAAGGLELRAAVGGDAAAQLAEDGDDPADLVDAVRQHRQVEGA